MHVPIRCREISKYFAIPILLRNCSPPPLKKGEVRGVLKALIYKVVPKALFFKERNCDRLKKWIARARNKPSQSPLLFFSN